MRVVIARPSENLKDFRLDLSKVILPKDEVPIMSWHGYTSPWVWKTLGYAQKWKRHRDGAITADVPGALAVLLDRWDSPHAVSFEVMSRTSFNSKNYMWENHYSVVRVVVLSGTGATSAFAGAGELYYRFPAAQRILDWMKHK